jgi:hypothetical protein
MSGPLLALGALVAGVLAVRRQRQRRLPAHAVIVSPRKSTVVQHDGAVRSVQSAKLTLDAGHLRRIWVAANLENLARTYWAFLTRVTLGLIRVRYEPDSRSVILLVRPLTLLRFEVPEYTIEPDHGSVRWQIRDGLLVARTGRGSGFLALDVRRLADREDGRAELLIEVEVANFYPSIAVGVSIPVYEMTQSVIHVLVTNAFLRSLAKLDLAQTRVGVLAGLSQPN